MFVYHKDIQRCHVGIFETDSGYLDGYTGDFPVHLSMSKCIISLKYFKKYNWFISFLFISAKLIEDLHNTYFQLTYVYNQDYWQKFIYKTDSLESPANELDCSFVCRNVEKNEPCDLFIFEVCTA